MESFCARALAGELLIERGLDVCKIMLRELSACRVARERAYKGMELSVGWNDEGEKRALKGFSADFCVR